MFLVELEITLVMEITKILDMVLKWGGSVRLRAEPAEEGEAAGGVGVG